jgi:hypothetical protein
MKSLLSDTPVVPQMARRASDYSPCVNFGYPQCCGAQDPASDIVDAENLNNCLSLYEHKPFMVNPEAQLDWQR